MAVFRVSGSQAREVIGRLCFPSSVPPPRQAVVRRVKNPESGELLDQVVILYFPAPHSFTGEDVVELHTHGGRAVIQAISAALASLLDFRLAEPGEFTRRAFENGKMDLTEAEAVADLVHAETEAQRRQALRQLDGALGTLYMGWSGRLARSLAFIEAAIDFADEDLPDDLGTHQTTALQLLRDEIAAHLNDNRRGERLRDGFSIALVGAPNAGKSSLLNALAQREAAIVSPVAGTTRDVIESHLDLSGYPVTLSDTAGLRTSGDVIEEEGVRRARAKAEQADLKLLIFDATQPPDPETLSLSDAKALWVMNKMDLVTGTPETLAARLPSDRTALCFLSVKTGAGMDALLGRLTQEITSRFGGQEAAPLTRARHRTALESARDHLDRALNAHAPDLRAEDVRLALRALGRITGRVDVEDLLDLIFKDFCIGK